VVAGSLADEIFEAASLGRVTGNRTDDEGIHAERLQVVEALGDTAKIAAAIAGRVLEAGDVNAIEDRTAPPGFHRDA
jgi:hypothetical protein